MGYVTAVYHCIGEQSFLVIKSLSQQVGEKLISLLLMLITTKIIFMLDTGILVIAHRVNGVVYRSHTLFIAT